MKNYYITLALFLLSTTAFSQTQENMLMERFFMNAFNPAYVGSEGKSIAIITRTTWSGVTQAPRSNYLYYSGAPKKNLSFGVSVISNKIYIDTRNQYAVDASYKLKLGGQYTLNLGLKAGMASKKTNLEDLDRITTESNPFITTTNQGNYPVFGAGFLIQGEKLYFSLGTPNFLNPEKFIDDSSFIQNQNPILYMAAGYSIDLGFFGSTINPYVTSRIIPGVPNQMSVGGNLNFKNIFEIGMGYKSIDYAFVMFMLKLKMGIDIGYATDFGVGNNSNISRSGFELFAKYRF
ncbi:PorP/SprF family type IX secretion system membrane protein [Flavobacteriaceae bacterium]|nr:PorP/SprF family type IX secretion system membrane protein [Flavobacteriaceae bacterium]MDB9886531.1 PorP/SprF family type IX secretion system membrane protein [Flavobacteriaceae bacterium]MDC1402340.1 PorP/SprF family type IX secretion system membrane protein [Flavobacteriaceae bacterium]